MSVKVSVIIPVYNRQRFAVRFVSLLKGQILPEIEFIIVDDASTDNTLSELQLLVANDRRFKIIANAVNKGPSSCRNIGLKIAAGKYMGFFDSDDEIPADYFAKLYQIAEENQADIVFALYNGRQHNHIQVNTLADKFKVLHNGAVWDKLYKSELIQKNGITFAEGLYTADNLFNIQAFSAASKIKLADSPVYKYALQNDSIGKDIAKTLRRKQDILEVCRQALAFAAAKNFSLEAQDALRDFLYRTYSCYREDILFQKKLRQLLGWKAFCRQKTTMKPYKGGVMTTCLLKTMRIMHLITKEKYNEKRFVEIIKTSPLFDTKWYLAQNPDVKSRKMSAAKHYAKYGWKEGRNPSILFDGNAYLAENEDVAAAGINPLAHYLISGYKEGRSYRQVNGGVTQPKIEEMNWYGKLLYALEYPIRLQEECDRLKAEIKDLEQAR